MCLQLHKRCGRGDPAGPLAQYRWDGIVLSRLGRDKGTRRRGGYPILRVHFTAALLYRAYHWGKKEGKEKCGSRVHTRFLRTLWRRAKFNDQALFLVCACAAKKAGTAKARQFQLDIGARRDPYSYDVNG